ncbi:MAG: MFS transporter [Sphingomonas sp.]
MTDGAPTIAAIIDRKPLGLFQLRIVFLCLLTQLVDGFDNQASAFVAPTLAHQWNVPREAFGQAFSAGAFGTMIGCLLIGPLGDLLGRKTVIISSLLLAAALMALTGSVTNLEQLTLIRFLTGMPLGVLIPATVVTASEWAPARGRAAIVTIMACGFSLGAMLGGLTSSVLLPHFPWASVFHLGAAVTLLVGIAALIGMPESLRYLSQRGDVEGRARVEALARRFDPNIGELAIVAPARQPRGLRLVTELFVERRGVMTLLLWGIFFMNALALNFMTFWLPSILEQMGMTLPVALRTSTLFQFGGLCGIVSIGLLAIRLGARQLILTVSLVAVAAVACVGLLDAMGRNMAIFAAGFCLIGIQMSMAAFTATLYPTQVRSTGTSWALGIGRLGSTVGPLIGQMLIGWHWEPGRVFPSIALASVCASICLLFLTLTQRAAAAR